MGISTSKQGNNLPEGAAGWEEHLQLLLNEERCKEAEAQEYEGNKQVDTPVSTNSELSPSGQTAIGECVRIAINSDSTSSLFPNESEYNGKVLARDNVKEAPKNVDGSKVKVSEYLQFLNPLTLWADIMAIDHKDKEWEIASPPRSIGVGLTRVFAVAVVGPKKAWELGPRKTWEVVVIKILGMIDSGKRFVSELLPHEEEEIEEEEAPKDYFIHNLEHLEDLSRKGELKRPTWMLPVLGVLFMLQVGFFFYLNQAFINQDKTVALFPKAKDVVSFTPNKPAYTGLYGN